MDIPALIGDNGLMVLGHSLIRSVLWVGVCAALVSGLGCTELNPTFLQEAGVQGDGAVGVEAGTDGAPDDTGGVVTDGPKRPPADGSLPPDKGPPPPPPTTSSLVAVPRALSFGAVGVGCEGTLARAFQIANPTNGGRSVVKAQLTGCSKEFSLKPVTKGTIPSGKSVSSAVTFTGASVGFKSCYIKVTTSDGQLIIPITAQVSAKTTQSDVFKQHLNRKVDFIFVLDPSGSMTDEKPRLKATASTFAAAAGSNKLDFHLGFISMVKGYGSKAPPLGALHGYPPYLTGAMKNLTSEFQKRIDMPQGGGQETGFDAIIASLTPPLASVINPKSCAGCALPLVCHKSRCIGPNEGFHRPDASLELLVFTDEDDGSKASLSAVKSFLLWQVDPLKGQFVRVHALLPSSKCAYGGVTFSRWKGLINSTGGQISDLCAADYRPAIKALTSRIFGLQDQFHLTRKAVASSIKVSVNGKAVTGYKYHSASRSLTFNTAPADKSTVRITYTVSCK